MTLHERNTKNDQITVGVGEGGACGRRTGAARLSLAFFQERFHTASVALNLDFEAILQNGLSRHHPTAARLSQSREGLEAQEDPTLLHAVLCGKTAPKKGALEQLLESVFQTARTCGLIDRNPEVSIDATGLESRYVSRHFLRRQGRMKRYRSWAKLTSVCHHASYLIASLRVTRGPSNDAPEFIPVVKQASQRLTIDRLLADAAYDAEEHHRLCREQLGVRSTVIPINPRGPNRKAPRTRYRGQMYRRFHNRIYRRRWHAESVFSQLKRLLGSELRARTWASRIRECYCKVLTHNLMVIRPST